MVTYYCILYSLSAFHASTIAADQRLFTFYRTEAKTEAAIVCPETRPGMGSTWVNRQEADAFVADFHCTSMAEVRKALLYSCTGMSGGDLPETRQTRQKWRGIFKRGGVVPEFGYVGDN